VNRKSNDPPSVDPPLLDHPEASNVRSSDTTNGVAGTIPVCSSDGQQNCFTNSTYPSVDTTSVSPSDVRVNISMGGLAGALKTNCRNTVAMGTYNFEGIVTAVSNAASTDATLTFDIWDTLDDYSGNTSDTPWAAAGSPYVCDSAGWTDITVGTCDAQATSNTICEFQDNASGLIVGKPASLSDVWAAAFSTCAASTYAGPKEISGTTVYSEKVGVPM